MSAGSALTQRRLRFHDANARLAERMPELARELAGDPTHRGRDHWRFRGKGSLAVVVAGPKRGAWHDHEAGHGGDALGLVAHLQRRPMRGALEWALGWLGDPATRGGSATEAHQRPPAAPER